VLTIDVSEARVRPGQVFTQHLIHLPKTGDLDDEVGLEEPVVVDVEYSFLKGVYLVKAKLKVKAMMACGRCLEPFTCPLEAEFYEQYDTATQVDEHDPDANVVIEDRIDLTEKVRAAIMGVVPMKPLCREDCPGLCSSCGIPQAEGGCACVKDDIDPRLKDLALLMEGLKKKGVE